VLFIGTDRECEKYVVDMEEPHMALNGEPPVTAQI
jgi:hypothetical protein